MIQPTEESFLIEKNVRYSTYGELEKATKLLIVLHGYGQLSRYFIRKFEAVSSDYFIVAPEGFHRFYLNGSSGRVGASWMTKEAREDDISDNNHYLQRLMQKISALKSFDKTVLLGFSQGGATAARFYYQSKESIDHLILWASVFPPDIPVTEMKGLSHAKGVDHFVLGTEDEYFDAAAQHKTLDFFESNGFTTHVYNGKHDIDAQTFNEVLSKIE